MNKISVVINTLNEEKNIERVLRSVKWVDEVIIVDDGSTDGTLEIVNRIKNQSFGFRSTSLTAGAQDKELRIKVFKHKSKGYVEPARNFAISKASGDWLLILDADEEISDTLADRLKEIAEKMHKIEFVEIPRKNIIFGKWMSASMWWPDYHVRFFRKGSVIWSDKIHSKPETSGAGIRLEAEEKWAIFHQNYETVIQFIERMNRYTSIQAKELMNDGIKFGWKDLIEKPVGEFLRRFFANKGYKDGIHGLALSMLQAFSFVVVYSKLWEMEKFQQQEIGLDDMKKLTKKAGDEIDYWLQETSLPKNTFKRFIQRVNKKFN